MRVSPETVHTLRQDDKIQPFERMGGIVRRLRASGMSVVLAQGVFDLVHRGHVGYLQASRAIDPETGVLIVGIENDASVARNKGVSRPINPADDRMGVLAEFMSTNMVFTYPNVPDYDNPDDYMDRYLELHPSSIAVRHWDPHLELKRRQANETGTRLSVVSHPYENSTTQMLQRLGYEE